MINQHLEQAKNNILAEKRSRIDQAKNAAMREVVKPHNDEIDQSLQRAIAELSKKRDTEISIVQKSFEEETASLVAIANKNKADFESATIASVEARISLIYDDTIASIEKVIEKAKEQ